MGFIKSSCIKIRWYCFRSQLETPTFLHGRYSIFFFFFFFKIKSHNIVNPVWPLSALFQNSCFLTTTLKESGAIHLLFIQSNLLLNWWIKLLFKLFKFITFQSITHWTITKLYLRSHTAIVKQTTHLAKNTKILILFKCTNNWPWLTDLITSPPKKQIQINDIRILAISVTTSHTVDLRGSPKSACLCSYYNFLIWGQNMG